MPKVKIFQFKFFGNLASKAFVQKNVSSGGTQSVQNITATLLLKRLIQSNQLIENFKENTDPSNYTKTK